MEIDMKIITSLYIIHLFSASATPPLMTSTSSANVVLLPPTAAPISSSPNNPVPLIIPHMAPGRDAQAPSSVVLQAAQGMPTTHVNQTPAHPGDRDLALPHFNDDEQLYHFVTSRLRKTLTDCSKQFTVPVYCYFYIKCQHQVLS